MNIPAQREVVLFTPVSSQTNTDTIDLISGRKPELREQEKVSVQVSIASTATVEVDVECRLDDSLEWAIVETGVAASKIIVIEKCAEVRLNVTSYSGSGNVGGGVMF